MPQICRNTKEKTRSQYIEVNLKNKLTCIGVLFSGLLIMPTNRGSSILQSSEIQESNKFPHLGDKNQRMCGKLKNYQNSDKFKFNDFN